MPRPQEISVAKAVSLRLSPRSQLEFFSRSLSVKSFAYVGQVELTCSHSMFKLLGESIEVEQMEDERYVPYCHAVRVLVPYCTGKFAVVSEEL